MRSCCVSVPSTVLAEQTAASCHRPAAARPAPARQRPRAADRPDPAGVGDCFPRDRAAGLFGRTSWLCADVRRGSSLPPSTPGLGCPSGRQQASSGAISLRRRNASATAASALRKTPMGLPGSSVSGEPVPDRISRTSSWVRAGIDRQHQRDRAGDLRRGAGGAAESVAIGVVGRLSAGQIVLRVAWRRDHHPAAEVAEERALVLRLVMLGRADQDRAGGIERLVASLRSAGRLPLPAATQTTQPSAMAARIARCTDGICS